LDELLELKQRNSTRVLQVGWSGNWFWNYFDMYSHPISSGFIL